MKFLKHTLMVAFLMLTVLSNRVESMGSSVKQAVGLLPSEYYDYLEMDLEERGEIMQELLQDRLELGIQHDLCPWAECTYCDCNGQMPTCSHPPPVTYRGPRECRGKKGSPQPGQCFFLNGKPSLDCKEKNEKFGVCFPKAAAATEQRICFMYTSDCENLVDFCNCTRACAALDRLPKQTPTTAQATTQRKTTVKVTARPTAPPTTNTQKLSKPQDDEAVLMTTWQGSLSGNGSDNSVTNTTRTPEGTTVASLSPGLQDFRTMLSSMGILAVVFGGLLLVCFVFIVTIVCTCSFKSRTASGHHTFKHATQEPHAYYYVDVDRNGTFATDSQKGTRKPDLTNPIYDVNKESSLNNLFTNEAAAAVYTEADTTGLVILAREPDAQFENLYAEVRPKSQVSPTEAVAYFELEDDRQGTDTLAAYTELSNDAVYTDLEYEHESVSSGSETRSVESDSETGSSTGRSDSGSSRRSSESPSSADSGVDDENKEDCDALSDFEGDNAHYFEATTLPLPHRAKSSGSLTSGGSCQTDSLKKIPEVVCDDMKENTPNIIEDNRTCYEKLHCKPKDRSFSIDSACSDNTYNALKSTGTLTLAEEDGKYSTLVREGNDGKKRDTVESSDSDNMYSELCKNNTDSDM